MSGKTDSHEPAGVWRSLTSLKLTLALFLLLAGASVVGTLVPQNSTPDEYRRLYGAVAAGIFELLGITDLYHSAWFMALLGMLVVHMVACSLQRLPATWKALKTPQRPLTEALFRSLPSRRLVEGGAAPSALLELLRTQLGRAGWKPKEAVTGDALHLMAQRGRWIRMGAYTAHLGVLVVLLGAALGFTFGFKGFVQIQEGEAIDWVQNRAGSGWRPLGFQVRCEKFHVSTYPDGTPKEYRSDLAFIQDGEVILKGALRVNHPMSFGGYVFYQASYGVSARVTLEARRDSVEPPRQLVMEPGDTTSLDPQGRVIIRLLRYEPDVQGRGPGVLLAHLRPDAPPVTGWVFQRDSRAVLEGWHLRLLEAQESRWTGLQVKQDPGVWVVWVGCFLIMGGCAMAFLGVHRRLWVRIEQRGGKTLCWIAASSNRNRPRVDRTVEALCKACQVEAGMRPRRKEQEGDG